MSKQETLARLKPEIGFLQLFSLSFGMIIGAAWITLLGFWIADAGPFGAVIAFGLGALILVPIGLCYAEMISIYPATGGPVVYCMKLLGPRAAFWAGWMILMTSVPVIALQGISIGWVMDALWPELRGPMLYTLVGSDVHLGDLLIGVGGLVVLAWINWAGGGAAGKTQEVLTGILVLTAVVLVVAAIYRGTGENLSPEFVVSSNGSIWPGVLAVFVTTPFLLSGFETIAQGAAERREGVTPRKTAWIMVTAIGAATVFYVLVILAAVSVVPRPELLSAGLPTAAAFELGLGSATLAKIALIGGTAGLVTSWNASVFVGMRVLLALGRAHLVWPGFARGTGKAARPTPSILLIAALSLIGILLGRNAVLPLVIACSIFIGVTFFLVAICVIVGRNRFPEMARPFRIPGGQLIPVLACISAATITILAFLEPWLLSSGGVPIEAWIAAGSIGLGVLIWVGSRCWRGGVSESEMEAQLLGL